MDFARALWLRIETVHAVTYFGSESVDAGAALGMSGFWMGYFGFRAAPLGSAGSGLVEATFANFAPSFVQRWVPQVWDVASPDRLIEARTDGAVATLRRLFPTIERVADLVDPVLESAVLRAGSAGRPLFAANRSLPLPDDPVRRLWQLCTCVREHRGDGHVAVLTTHEADGLHAHVLIAAEQGTSPEDLQRTRGWTADDWVGAVDRLSIRGLVEQRDGRTVLTPAGRTLRAAIERRTDELAAVPFGPLSDAERSGLIDALDPVARTISESGTIRYPNPMGLPPLE